MKSRIVITGVGPLSSLGVGKDQTWKNILSGNVGLEVERVYVGGEIWEEFYINKIKNFDLSESKWDLNKKVWNEILRWKGEKRVVDLDYFLASMELALSDSRLCYSGKSNVGVVLAHENPGMNQFFREIFDVAYNKFCSKQIKKKEFFEQMFSLGAKQAYDLQTFTFLFHIAKMFDIHGFSLFINNACASGLYAVEAASDIIRSGKCDAVIVAAVDSPDIYKYMWFRSNGMYSNDGIVKPFCDNSNGFIFGEGGAAIVLENHDFARKRKARIYAEYIGGEFFLEGWKVSYPAIKESYYENVICDLMRKNKIKVSDVDVINPHGVGNKIIDRYEANAIVKIFGNNSQKPYVTALKPYVGHALGGSALLELVILLIAQEKGEIPPTLNVDLKHSILPNKLVSKMVRHPINCFLKTCTAFAGFDAAVAIRKVPT